MYMEVGMNDFFDEFTMVCLSIFGAGITFILFQTFLFAKDNILSKIILKFLKGIA